MAKNGYWYAQATQVMRDTVRQATQDGVTDPAEVMRRVNAAYPFGERKYHPYKMWLKARADMFGRTPQTTPRSGDRAKLMEWEAGAKQW